MAPQSHTLKIRSHNVNGFEHSREFLYDECRSDSFSLLAIQEHWLRPAYRKQMGINRMKVLHPDFDAFGVSAMASQVEKSVMKGRPHGGTGFIFEKRISNNIRACTDIKHNRVSVMELSTINEKIMFINCYMPYFNPAKRAEILIEYREVIGFIENIMSSHSSHKFVLLMDMNCNIFNASHDFSILINGMMRDFDLVSNYDFVPGFDAQSDYTRFDRKRGSYTLIDGILISRSLSPLVQSSSILHPPLNVSDHLPVEIVLNVELGEYWKDKPTVSNFIPWSSLSEDELFLFRHSMSSSLKDISLPISALNHSDRICENCNCAIALEKFYCDIVGAVEVADRCLPRKKHGLAKPYWSPELSAAKQRSYDAHKLWLDCSCPRSGPLFNEKVQSNYRYKLLLRQSKNIVNSSVSDSLSNNLLNNDRTSFWANWKKINGSQLTSSSMIDGHIGDRAIVDCFSESFRSIYAPAGSNDSLRDRFSREYEVYKLNHADDLISPFLLSWPEMVDAAMSMKLSKATSTFLKSEHLFNGAPELLCYLHLLFNGLISHGYLPHEFLQGTISPLVKDANGDVADSTNYRGITLSPCLSQLFEYCLWGKFGSYILSDDLQFGFKRSHSTSHAIFTLKSCVDYFLKYRSNVFVTFLDLSKDFDKISHYGIFIKLMERGAPLCFLNLVIYLYLNMQSRCRWGSEYSEYFRVTSGTKQGGIISPRIFTMYMNDLIVRLRRKGLGCHVLSLFLACLFYADDLCLIAPSRGSMQEMLCICEDYCHEFGLAFNVKKTKALFFGNFKGEIAPLNLYGQPIQFVKEWVYLGTTIVSGKSFSFSAAADLRAFYRSSNSILSALRKPNVRVQINLLYSNCIPSLSYAADVKVFSYDDI